MINKIYPPCKKCGASHGMGLENMETGEIEPIEYCRSCLFPPLSMPREIDLYEMLHWEKVVKSMGDKYE